MEIKRYSKSLRLDILMNALLAWSDFQGRLRCLLNFRVHMAWSSFFLSFLFNPQDRLIALDAADDFFKIASQMYPKKPGVPCLVDGQRKLPYLPFPSP